MEADTNRIKNLLQGLGKSTKRGIKVCVKCGFYNGTRAMFCKNVLCDAILKPTEDIFKLLIKACKLITDKDTQVYSIIVNEKGPDHRGFVQIPINSSSGGLCFIEACPKTFNSSILKCHEKDQIQLENNLLCQHIEAARQCSTLATALSLNPVIIDQMNVLPVIKQGLWNILSDNNYSTSGPCVQRISRAMFVVKCKTSPKHPLGYLHLTIFSNVKHKDKPEYRHYCSCPVEYKDLSSFGSDINEKKCVHYYAVICAFASDQKLAQEFSHFMQTEQVLTMFVDQYLPTEDPLTIFDLKSADILVAEDNVMGQELEVELIASGTDSEMLLDMNNVLTFLKIEYEPPNITSNNVPDSQKITSSHINNQHEGVVSTNINTANTVATSKTISIVNSKITDKINVDKTNNNIEFKSKRRKLSSSKSNVNSIQPSNNSNNHSKNIIRYLGKIMEENYNSVKINKSAWYYLFTFDLLVTLSRIRSLQTLQAFLERA